MGCGPGWTPAVCDAQRHWGCIYCAIWVNHTLNLMFYREAKPQNTVPWSQRIWSACECCCRSWSNSRMQKNAARNRMAPRNWNSTHNYTHSTEEVKSLVAAFSQHNQNNQDISKIPLTHHNLLNAPFTNTENKGNKMTVSRTRTDITRHTFSVADPSIIHNSLPTDVQLCQSCHNF